MGFFFFYLGNSPISCRHGWKEPAWRDLGAGREKGFSVPVNECNEGKKLKKEKRWWWESHFSPKKVIFKGDNRDKKREKEKEDGEIFKGMAGTSPNPLAV